MFSQREHSVKVREYLLALDILLGTFYLADEFLDHLFLLLHDDPSLLLLGDVRLEQFLDEVDELLVDVDLLDRFYHLVELVDQVALVLLLHVGHESHEGLELPASLRN